MHLYYCRHVTDISCSICELQLSDAEMAAHMALHQVTVAELQRALLSVHFFVNQIYTV